MPGRFGDKLQYLRDRASLSQSDLARQLGDLTQSHLSYLESGQKAPSLATAARLATYFAIPIDYLLRDELPVSPAPDPSQAGWGSSELHPGRLGPRLRDLRQKLGMSQQELALRLGVTSRPFISLIESGRKTPSPEVALRLADILGVTVDDLLAEPNLPKGL